jgi:peptidoglycan/LPS O-acetylase OafA/YrhL
LPGVFETNAIPSTINGSLWTLRFEFDCYIALAAIWIIGGFKARKWIRAPVVSLVSVGILAVAVELHRNDVHQPAFILFFSFACGTGAYLWRDRIRLSRIASVIALVVAAAVNFFVPCPTLLCAVYFYALLAFGFQKSPGLEWYNKLGDYSYGTYIYAFPIQQTLASTFPRMSPIEMFLFAFPITVLMAVLSWKFVERPALALK